MTQWTQLMRAPVRDVRIGGRIVFGSGREYALTGDAVSALVIDEGVDGALVPGCVLCAECTLDLVNDEGQWLAGGIFLGADEPVGATVLPELGAADGGDMQWRPLGAYQVESAVYLEEEGILRLRALDSIGRELAGAFLDGLSYPRTLKEVWLHAVSQTRYIWNGQLPNADAVIDVAPEWKEASLRMVLGYIACAAGCFVRIGRGGGMELCPIWNGEADAYNVDAQNYLRLEREHGDYGPVDSLRLKPVGADEARIYRADGEGGRFALEVSQNPLLRADAPGLDALARGMLSCVSGYCSAAMRFEWRGDPELEIGRRVLVCDASGNAHAGVLARQTLRFSSEGFSASGSCAVPEGNDSGVRRAITPEGWLNGAALSGAVDGSLLSVGSVTANKLAAGSITAEKIAAGALDAITLNAVTAKLESLTASDITTDKLAAALAAFMVVTAGTASFDRAAVQHLVAQALNLEFGTADQVFIRNLAVQYAQMVGAAIGELCIRASDGNYYLMDVKPDGTVTATKTTVTEGETSAGQTGGRVILETDITAQQLNTGNLLATYALINRIDAARIDVDQLFAREAFVSLLRTSKIVGDKSITLIAREAEAANRNYHQAEPPTGKDMVRPGDTWTIPETGQLYQAEDASDLNLKFWLDDDGGLYYELEEGDADISLSVRGFDLYGDGLYFTVLEDGALGAPYVWRRVQDRELAQAIEEALSKEQFEHYVQAKMDGLHVGLLNQNSGYTRITYSSFDVINAQGGVTASLGDARQDLGSLTIYTTADGHTAFVPREA